MSESFAGSFIESMFFAMFSSENEIHRLQCKTLVAMTSIESGELARGYKMLKEVASREAEFLDPKDRVLLFTQSHLARALDKLERFDESLALYEDVMGKMRSTMGDDDSLTITTQMNMAVAMQNAGAPWRAFKQFEDVFEKKKRILGPEDPETFKAQTGMAKALVSLDRFTEAFDIYTDVFNRRKEKLGPSHPDTLRTQGLIGYVLFRQAKYSEALSLLNQVVAKQKSILGEAHPETQGFMSYIQYLKQEVGPKKFAQLQSFCKKNDDHTKLVALINAGDISGVEDLLESGIDITRVTGENGNTPLHLAVNKDSINIIESLLMHAHSKLTPSDLQKFINARRTSAVGSTAMHIAASNGSLAAIKVLLKYGAALKINNKKGKTPRELAKDPEVASFLEKVDKTGQYQDH